MLIEGLSPDVLPLSSEIAALARTAAQRFGRGNHPANLNFGDCLVYATAKYYDEPLLFKGKDFALTDIVPVF